MLQVELGDVLGVLGLCVPYLIAIGVVLAAGIAAMIVCRKFEVKKKFLIRSQAAMAMVLALVTIVNLICFGPMSTLIGLATGSGTVKEETTEKAKAVAKEISGEGIVLLENQGLLPLASGTRLNLFGWASANPVYGGSGSGGLNDLYEKVSLKDSLVKAGFELNDKLEEFYLAYTSDRPEMSIQKQSWTLPEPPADTYSQELISEAQAFSDTAVIVLSRIAGEGHSDMPKDVSKVAYDQNSTAYADFEEGDHYLMLSQTEEDMVNLVCENFENVIVLYNGANPIQLGFVNEHPQIQSVVWCPGPGNVGFESLGQILCGERNPSGKTPDTFVYDVTQAPWWNNWVKTGYTNLEDMAVDGMNAGRPEIYAPSFINYVEGIYVGYKYYETAAAEGVIDYDKTVQYPFGHGLSYTTFEQTMGELREENGEISFDVTVTNTGDRAGKDVVEVYYNPPYTDGGIEKASANLIEFEKTKELLPGESETLTIQFKTEDLASFDAKTEKAYVLDSGEYVISINRDSHTVLDQKIWNADQKVVYNEGNSRSTDQETAVNRFDDAKGDVTYLSRAGHFANLEEASAAPATVTLEEPYLSGYHLNANFDYTTYIDESEEMPVTGAAGSMKLAELRGADYDDPRWEQLLDQMKIDEMANLIAMAGYQTAAVESVEKAATVDCDGPAAINHNFTGAGSIGFPIEVVVASTWNKELAEQYGEIMAQMCREMNVQGWYAPGMNIHRTPFGGRNYEYFSEDGVLSGKIGSGAVKGAMSLGVYPYIKHFALYDGNFKMVCIWAEEQSIRETYLKPFEICVKDGKADALMVSWNFIGNKWAGECSNLLNDVLRGEWGFRGMALTDFFRNNGHGFMNADMALANGVDAMLSTYNGEANNVRNPQAATSVRQMRNASKNIMYTVVNSWAYEDGDAGAATEPWKYAAAAIDGVLAVLWIGAELLIVKKYKKK